MRFTPTPQASRNKPSSEPWVLQRQAEVYERMARFTPTICLRQDQHQANRGWLLEVASCERLFGGLNGLLNTVWESLDGLEYPVYLGRHATATGAWWISKHKAAERHADWLEQDTCPALDDLPVQALDAPLHTLQTWEQCGFHTLAQLMNLPRDGFIQRFGNTLRGELDSGFGLQHRDAPALLVHAPTEFFEQREELPFHTQQHEALLRHAERLLKRLEDWLNARQEHTRALHWTFEEAHAQIELPLRSANPMHQAKDWLHLLKHRLQRLPFTDDVRHVLLRCEHTEPWQTHSLSLFPSATETETHWDSTCDLLRARLGEQAVLFAHTAPDPRPEHSLQFKPTPAQASQRKVPTALPGSTPRPLWLLPQARAVQGALPSWTLNSRWQLLSGPERVDYGWWDNTPCQRDYYCAMNPQRSMVWIYRDLQMDPPQWYWHGVFA
ncbi:hypothetical protein NQT62_05190 [Limnobacter humi]|uniref:DNA polymerase Y family protein n=1 Tax=Limnobacter humi TaxID=1778671 RepID=A0ABT1WE82_9BURK|nr:hypothetical protein [Limnobacter humi]MCQ8895832.1 hypothetical protein [Limnobacter humi]